MLQAQEILIHPVMSGTQQFALYQAFLSGGNFNFSNKHLYNVDYIPDTVLSILSMLTSYKANYCILLSVFYKRGMGAELFAQGHSANK